MTHPVKALNVNVDPQTMTTFCEHAVRSGMYVPRYSCEYPEIPDAYCSLSFSRASKIHEQDVGIGTYYKLKLLLNVYYNSNLLFSASIFWSSEILSGKLTMLIHEMDTIKMLHAYKVEGIVDAQAFVRKQVEGIIGPLLIEFVNNVHHIRGHVIPVTTSPETFVTTDWDLLD